MSRLKRVALVLVAVLLVVVAGLGAVWWATFGAAAPLGASGPTADGRATLVVDGYVSVHLVPLASPGHVAVVDCGLDQGAKTVLAALAAQQLTVDAILVTHGHADHAGGCTALKAQTRAPIYALATEADELRGDQPSKSPIGRLMGPHHLGVTIDVPLQDGASVDVGGTRVHVWAVPGHTAGHAAYVVNDLLLLGDAAVARKDGALGGPPWLFSTDVAQANASLRKLGERLAAAEAPPVAWAVFGHAAPLFLAERPKAALPALFTVAP